MSVERYHDGDSIAGVSAVVHVIAVSVVVDIYVVILVPIVRPIFGPRVKKADPITVVWEPGIPAKEVQPKAEDAETVIPAKVDAETIIRNTISVIATTLSPIAV